MPRVEVLTKCAGRSLCATARGRRCARSRLRTSRLSPPAFERLSEESRYRRFFTTKNELSAAELDYLVDVDHEDHEAIIAIDPSSGEVLGVARYIRSKDDAEVAEVAVTVADDWQRRGLGRALLRPLDLSRATRGRAPVQRARPGRQPGGPQAARGRRRHSEASMTAAWSSSSSSCPSNAGWGRTSPGRCERRRQELSSRR